MVSCHGWDVINYDIDVRRHNNDTDVAWSTASHSGQKAAQTSCLFGSNDTISQSVNQSFNQSIKLCLKRVTLDSKKLMNL